MKKIVILNFIKGVSNIFLEFIFLIMLLIVSVIAGGCIYFLVNPWVLFVVLGGLTAYSLFKRETAVFSLSGILICGLSFLLMGHVTTLYFLITFAVGALLWLYSLDKTFSR